MRSADSADRGEPGQLQQFLRASGRMSATTTIVSPTAICLRSSGPFPNNGRLPLLIYKRALPPSPQEFEQAFAKHTWSEGGWRDGVYTFHHYHTTAHEVLGAYQGWCLVRFGGEDGTDQRFEAGDVVVIPAGVAHKAIDQSPDFRCVGSYPRGQMVDMLLGEPGDRPAADERIRTLPLPLQDPVYGSDGPLMQLWH